jgi:CysZ protein
VDGALALPRAFAFLFRTRGALLLSAVPAGILVLLFALLAWGALSRLEPALAGLLPGAASTWGRWAISGLRLLVSAVLVVLSALSAAWLTPLLAGPALERLVLLRERDLGLPEREPVSFLVELWCGLGAQVLGLVVVGPILALLWLVTILAPPALVVTLPLKVLAASGLLAWSLLDYPLSLRGVRLRERLRLLRLGLPAMAGFGLAIAALFAIPLGPVLLLPAGVAAATELAQAFTRAGADPRGSRAARE